MHQLMRAHPLATLVTLDDTGLVANHIPMEIDASAGEHGTLRCHVARGNPLWKSHRAGVDGLAIFHGPHDYISPGFYPSKAENPEVVPTWNYATVHAHGPLQAIEDAAWLRALVERLTERHEGARHQQTGDEPWQVSDAPERYLEKMIKAIVGIEIPIRRLEGKWKMSQNRPAEDRSGVVAGLERGGEPMQRAVAELVRERS